LVGARDQCGFIGVAPHVETGNTDTGGHADLGFDTFSQTLAQVVRFLQLRRCDQGKLLAAIARRECVIADRTAQFGTNLAQDVVTGEMPVRVVVGFEVIDIEHQHRQRTVDKQGTG